VDALKAFVQSHVVPTLTAALPNPPLYAVRKETLFNPILQYLQGYAPPFCPHPSLL